MKLSFLCVIGLILLCQVAKSTIIQDPDYPQTSPILSYTECANRIGLNPEVMLTQVKSGQWHDDEKPKEWVHCVLVKNEVMTEQGVIRKDVALKYWSKFDARTEEHATKEENIVKCMPPDSYGMRPEEISWEFAKCLMREDPKNSLF